jgi:hypothetical protein
LVSLGLAAATINQRLAAVRRLAYEAADSGLLSPELAAGIRRVKGVKHLGQRSGNWLNIDPAQLLVDKSDSDGLRNKRDFAMISILLGCGLRRAEPAPERRKQCCFAPAGRRWAGLRPRGIAAFIRAPDQREKSTGYGLGLAFVDAVARAHGGTASALCGPLGV